MENRAFQTEKWGASENQPPINTAARFMYIQNLDLEVHTYLGIKGKFCPMAKMGYFITYAVNESWFEKTKQNKTYF